MSGLLINLAVIRDAEPTESLHYRFVDDGRVREHNYVVANDMEDVAVGGTQLQGHARESRRVGQRRNRDLGSSGVPTPIRMLQRENGGTPTTCAWLEYR